MNNQADNKNVIITKTLQVLIKHNHLTPAEVVQLRLSHLHLAGKNPTISFTPAGQQEPKVITLDMETHRALVGWLVNRPDSTGDFLFPGEGDEAMSLEAIESLFQAVESASPPPPLSGSDLPKPVMPPEADLSHPVEPPPSASRPVRPLSRPEMGTPPPGAASMGAAFAPPPTAPEEEPVNIPLPASAPVPPATRPPASRPVSPPRPPSGPISRPEPPPSAPAAAAPPSQTDDAPATPDPEATVVGAKIKAEAAAAAPPAEKSAEQTLAAPVKKEAKSVSMPPVKKVEPALAAKDKPTMARPLQERSGWSRPLIPGIIVIVLLCAVCLAGSWYIGQSETGSQFLASLGWSGQPTDEANEATNEAVVFESALPTPTLPPTATLTPLPPTHTPPPTETATPTPFLDTPTPVGTDTPTPTDTPEPTDTPAPEEEVEEDVPPTPTPGLKYSAPEILDPKDGFAFIRGNTIVLRWKPVELAPNEQYAVRLVYIYQGQPAYQGANIKESEWTVPLSLFGQIDGPDNRYEWFVVIERLNDDGSGTAVSPESQHRTFSWK